MCTRAFAPRGAAILLSAVSVRALAGQGDMTHCVESRALTSRAEDFRAKLFHAEIFRGKRCRGWVGFFLSGSSSPASGTQPWVNGPQIPDLRAEALRGR